MSQHEVRATLSRTEVSRAARPDPMSTDRFNMSLQRHLVPRSFKESPVTCNNDHMKCLERLSAGLHKMSDPRQLLIGKTDQLRAAFLLH